MGPSRRLLAVVLLTTACRFKFDGETGDASGIESSSAAMLVGRKMIGGWGLNRSMTIEGTLDWSHWGLAGVGDRNRKAGVTTLISDFRTIGTGVLVRSSSADPVSWSDGTPTATATTTGYIYWDVAGPQGDGLELDIAADTSMRTATLYLGNWCERMRVEASLDDGSELAYLDATWEVAVARNEIATFAFDYRALSASKLLIRLTTDFNYCQTGDLGEVKLMAATVH